MNYKHWLVLFLLVVTLPMLLVLHSAEKKLLLDYSTASSLLEKGNVISYEIDEEIFRVKLGLSKDYDKISILYEDLFRNYVDLKNVYETKRSAVWDFFFGKEYDFESRALVIKELSEAIGDFKSSFSIYKNSEMSFVQIVEGLLKSSDNLDKEKVNGLIGLERYLFVNEKISDVLDKKYINNIFDVLLLDLSDEHLVSEMQFLESHFFNIIRYSKSVESYTGRSLTLLQVYRDLSLQLNIEIKSHYDKYDSILSLYVSFCVCLAFLVFILFILQLKRSLQNSRNLDKKNSGLMQTIKSQVVDKDNLISQLSTAKTDIEELIDSIDGMVWEYVIIVNEITFVSSRSRDILGLSQDELLGDATTFYSMLHPDDVKERARAYSEAIDSCTGRQFSIQQRLVLKSGDIIHVRNNITPIIESGRVTKFRGILFDISKYVKMSEEQKALELELQQAHKMEAVGQLAAGIAHEINTPAQFIGDNIKYFQDAFVDINKLFDSYDVLLAGLSAIELTEQTKKDVDGIASCSDEIDLPFIREDIPVAISQALDGVSRIASIVKAMKEFSHPGTETKELVSLNKAIDSTLTVARNEWKYCAEISREFDQELPMVECHIGELNQVILNMIVNGAHAIEDQQKESGNTSLGCITIRTALEENLVVIQISDTGAGIEKENIKKIFEPFFTTKSVGKGSGQGLYIAYSVVVEKHNGEITVESEVGSGTTFTIKLPIKSEKKNDDIGINDIGINDIGIDDIGIDEVEDIISSETE